MSKDSSAAVAENRRSAITGYVEAITAEAALGWVWQPGSSTRLPVQLRHGDTIVAEAVADGLRQDLAQSGIGDGRHAFTLPIPGSMRQDAAGLRVVAISEDGAELPLQIPPAILPEAARIAHLQKSVDTLIASQRLLHRNLQVALLQQPASGTLTEIAAAQTELRQAIETVELFAIRLEQQSAATEPPARPPVWNRTLASVAALATAALIVSACLLVHSLMVG